MVLHSREYCGQLTHSKINFCYFHINFWEKLSLVGAILQKQNWYCGQFYEFLFFIIILPCESIFQTYPDLDIIWIYILVKKLTPSKIFFQSLKSWDIKNVILTDRSKESNMFNFFFLSTDSSFYLCQMVDKA